MPIPALRTPDVGAPIQAMAQTVEKIGGVAAQSFENYFNIQNTAESRKKFASKLRNDVAQMMGKSPEDIKYFQKYNFDNLSKADLENMAAAVNEFGKRYQWERQLDETDRTQVRKTGPEYLSDYYTFNVEKDTLDPNLKKYRTEGAVQSAIDLWQQAKKPPKSFEEAAQLLPPDLANNQAVRRAMQDRFRSESELELSRQRARQESSAMDPKEMAKTQRADFIKLGEMIKKAEAEIPDDYVKRTDPDKYYKAWDRVGKLKMASDLVADKKNPLGIVQAIQKADKEYVAPPRASQPIQTQKEKTEDGTFKNAAKGIIQGIASGFIGQRPQSKTETPASPAPEYTISGQKIPADTTVTPLDKQINIIIDQWKKEGKILG